MNHQDWEPVRIAQRQPFFFRRGFQAVLTSFAGRAQEEGRPQGQDCGSDSRRGRAHRWRHSAADQARCGFVKRARVRQCVPLLTARRPQRPTSKRAGRWWTRANWKTRTTRPTCPPCPRSSRCRSSRYGTQGGAAAQSPKSQRHIAQARQAKGWKQSELAQKINGNACCALPLNCA